MPAVRRTYCLSPVVTPPEDEEVNAPAAVGKGTADTLTGQLPAE
jgi:hypothetical protein